MSLEAEQVKKAVAALFQYLEKKKGKETGEGGGDDGKEGETSGSGEKKELLQLFEDEEFVIVTIGLTNVPDKSKVNAYRIPLAHSIYAGAEICLFTKDPASAIEDKLLDNPVEEVKQVIGVSTLRTDYRQYEDKRNLMATYDLFFADDRIIPLLPPLIGKKFFTRGKQPISICLSRSDMAGKIASARDSTYLYLRGGPCCAIKVAKTGFTVQETVENIMAAVPQAVKKIPGKWKSVQSIHLKTSSSISLPMYKALPRDTRIE
eukprot:jgi/Bigna1/53779/estExt_Genewise1Plus.C_240034